MTSSNGRTQTSNMERKFGGDDDDESVGQEYIQEVKNVAGAVGYYCSLCAAQFDSKLIVLHSRGRRHKEQYLAVKERETDDDRLVIAKYDLLTPTDDEFESVKNIVLSCEKALKNVSDYIAQCDEGNGATDAEAVVRNLKGVMRAGVLANGLMMRGELNVELVVLSADKPTWSLLNTIVQYLPEQIAAVTDGKYEVSLNKEDASIVVTSVNEPIATCTIHLTSALMRKHPFNYYNEIAPPDPADVLPHDQCEGSLRSLRRARWFETKAYSLPYSDAVIRIFRDLCQRVPTWAPLDLWTLELLVHKCLSSAESNSSPGQAVQRVFECVASGMMLPDAPGVYDPCEREPTDLCTQLAVQDREYITASAQHALRLISFDQMHKIIGIPLDVLQTATVSKLGLAGYKRKRTTSNTDFSDEKKDRKDQSYA